MNVPSQTLYLVVNHADFLVAIANARHVFMFHLSSSSICCCHLPVPVAFVTPCTLYPPSFPTHLRGVSSYPLSLIVADCLSNFTILTSIRNVVRY